MLELYVTLIEIYNDFHLFTPKNLTFQQCFSSLAYACLNVLACFAYSSVSMF